MQDMPPHPHRADLADDDYVTLARFRWELRSFLRFSELAAREAGLNAQQYQALLAIRATPARMMFVGELADELLVRPHTATELVDRLEKAGLVSRAQVTGDRRQVSVELTAKTVTMLATLSNDHRQELQRLRPMLTGLLKRL